MGFRINTNVAAMNAHMHSVNNNVGLDKSLSALSSGHRINKAADDAAGLSIANKLSAQAEGLGQAIKNANDGIGLIQTADGALEEYGNILKRVRTLATQAANDTQSTESRAAISDEISSLMSEASDIASTTSFNGMKILDGSQNSGTFTFHTAAKNSSSTSLPTGRNYTTLQKTRLMPTGLRAGASDLSKSSPDAATDSPTGVDSFYFGNIFKLNGKMFYLTLMILFDLS